MVNDVCQVVDCSKSKKDVTLHSIPSDQRDAAIWIDFLQLANKNYPTWKQIKRMQVCSIHFKRDDFRVGVSGKRYIIKGRFPSIHNSKDLSTEIQPKCRHAEELVDTKQNHVRIIDTLHSECNLLISSQMNVIQQLQTQIKDLKKQNQDLRLELNDLKTKKLRNLTLRLRRTDIIVKRKEEDIQCLQEKVKRLKTDWSLPAPATNADELLMELIRRRNVPKSQQYSEKLKTFAFNAMYISPKGYRHLHANLGSLLPHPTSKTYWMKDVHAPPGMLKQAVLDVKTICSASENSRYYSLAFDEMAIRQQLIFDGYKMVGTTDYGNILMADHTELAKSALFCLATEINGRKSFPLAYILTNGLKSVLMAEFVKKCIGAVSEAGGHVLSITFDGLRSNFTAMEILGANLSINEEKYKPFIEGIGQRKVYLIPDASHMVKLIRNTIDRLKIMYNGDNEIIDWRYVKALAKVQDEEGLRPATKLTTQHVHYHAKKMNTKLCVQTLSCSTATGIDFCRKIGLSDFNGSEATVEFLRVCDMVFDILNTKPFGKGKQTALSKHNRDHWTSVIHSASDYLMKLKVYEASRFVPLYHTRYGTCIKGLITCLASVNCIMNEMETGQVHLMFLPTYRLSQDPVEIFFGTLRSRLGSNDNPNVLQLAYSVRAMLCFKLNACVNGNCQPQEDLLDCVNLVNQSQIDAEESDEDENADCSYEVDAGNISSLSLFIENIVVYIAGYVGKKLKDRLDCDECISALITTDREYMQLREDFCLLLDKDRGGLCKPSEDLIIVCKVAERVIRREQSKDLLKLNGEKLCLLVRRECLDRKLFYNLHNEYFSSSLKQAHFNIHLTHKINLINEISKVYSRTRLHYIAKNFSLQSKSFSKRHKLRKLVHFRNE